jgi:excisionase family DNA binding protein
MAEAELAPLPRLALSVQEAAEALGVSEDFWLKYIADEVRIVRRGRRKIIPVTELQRWLDENGQRLHEYVGTSK